MQQSVFDTQERNDGSQKKAFPERKAFLWKSTDHSLTASLLSAAFVHRARHFAVKVCTCSSERPM